MTTILLPQISLPEHVSATSAATVHRSPVRTVRPNRQKAATMPRAVFARTKPRHLAALRSIATAVRHFEESIPESPTRYPTILSLDLPFQPTPADYHLYGIVLGTALDRAVKRLQRRPDIDTIQSNVGLALAGLATH